MATSIKKLTVDFLKSHRNHNTMALKVTLANIEHWLEHNDWECLSRLVMGTDDKMANTIRVIIGKVLVGAKGCRDKNSETGFRFSKSEDFGASHEMDTLRELVAEGMGIYHDKVKLWLYDDEDKPAKVMTIDNATTHVLKYLADRGFTLEMVIATQKEQASKLENGVIPQAKPAMENRLTH